jgi:hypothetical protein
MRAYLLTTGALFGLLAVTHLLRLVLEPGHTLAADPWFVGVNGAMIAVGGALAVWAWRLLRALPARAA